MLTPIKSIYWFTEKNLLKETGFHLLGNCMENFIKLTVKSVAHLKVYCVRRTTITKKVFLSLLCLWPLYGKSPRLQKDTPKEDDKKQSFSEEQLMKEKRDPNKLF